MESFALSESLVLKETELKSVNDVDVDLSQSYCWEIIDKLGFESRLKEELPSINSFYEVSFKKFIESEVDCLKTHLNSDDKIKESFNQQFVKVNEKVIYHEVLKAFVIKNMYLHDNVNVLLSDWQSSFFNKVFIEFYNTFSCKNENKNENFIGFYDNNWMDVILFITFWHKGLLTLKNPIKIKKEAWEAIESDFGFKSKLEESTKESLRIMLYAIIYESLQNNQFVDEETKIMMWEHLYGKWNISLRNNPYQKQREFLINQLNKQNFDYKKIRESLIDSSCYYYDGVLLSKDKFIYLPSYKDTHMIDNEKMNLIKELSMFEVDNTLSLFLGRIMFSANTINLYFKLNYISLSFESLVFLVRTEITEEEYNRLLNLPTVIVPFDFLFFNNMHKFHYYEYLDEWKNKLVKMQNKSKKEIIAFLRNINEKTMYDYFNEIVKKKKVKSIFQTLKSMNKQFKNLDEKQKAIEIRVHHENEVKKQIKKFIKKLDEGIKTYNVNKNKIRFVKNDVAANFVRNFPYIFSINQRNKKQKKKSENNKK